MAAFCKQLIFVKYFINKKIYTVSFLIKRRNNIIKTKLLLKSLNTITTITKLLTYSQHRAQVELSNIVTMLSLDALYYYQQKNYIIIQSRIFMFACFGVELVKTIEFAFGVEKVLVYPYYLCLTRLGNIRSEFCG